MIKDETLKRIVLDARKEIKEKYPYLNGPLSREDRKIKTNKYGRSIKILPDLHVILMEKNVFFLTLYGLCNESVERNAVIDSVIKHAEKQKVSGFVFDSDTGLSHPIGSAAKQLWKWVQTFPTLELAYDGELRINVEGTEMPSYKVNYTLESPCEISLMYQETLVDTWKKEEDIASFIQYQQSQKKQMDEATKILGETIKKRFPFIKFLNGDCRCATIFDQIFIFSIYRTYDEEQEKEIFYHYAFDERIEDENMDYLIEKAKKRWIHYITTKRVRHLVGMKEGDE